MYVSNNTYLKNIIITNRVYVLKFDEDFTVQLTIACLYHLNQVQQGRYFEKHHIP